MTDVLVMPGVRPVYLPDMPAQLKVAWLEDLAGVTGLTRDMTFYLLRRVCCESLTGEALMDLWLLAENAIACRNATDPDDAEYEGYEDRAADAVHDLIHGTGPARGSRNNTGGIPA